jgi:hypothetical protein
VHDVIPVHVLQSLGVHADKAIMLFLYARSNAPTSTRPPARPVLIYIIILQLFYSNTPEPCFFVDVSANDQHFNTILDQIENNPANTLPALTTHTQFQKTDGTLLFPCKRYNAVRWPHASMARCLRTMATEFGQYTYHFTRFIKTSLTIYTPKVQHQIRNRLHRASTSYL